VQPGRAAAVASGAAGVGGHPVQGPVHHRPSTLATPPGTKGDQAGIWQSAMCLRVRPALSAAAPLPRGQESQRMPQGASWDWGGVEDSVVVVDIKIEIFIHSLGIPLRYYLTYHLQLRTGLSSNKN
jgi:hypothetical protein